MSDGRVLVGGSPVIGDAGFPAVIDGALQAGLVTGREQRQALAAHRFVVGDGRRADVAEVIPAASDDADEWQPGCSWAARDLTRRSVREQVTPSALGVYPGKRHLLSGEPDDGKTMLALIESVERIRAGETVAYLDLDGMGEDDTYDRLHDLGLADSEISARFAYAAPDEPATEPEARDMLDRLVTERRPSLVVIDSYTGALELHGLSPDRSYDVQRLHRVMVAPLAALGAATLLIDHLPKNRENRGKFSIGSERKLGLVHVHLGVEVVTPFGRGRSGLVRLHNKRDRLSRLPRPFVCEVELRSDPDTDALTWTTREAAADGQAFRPTVLMERVSRFLEQQHEPVSRNTVETGVHGNDTYLRKAMDALVSEGFASELRGERSARLLTSRQPFRSDANATTSATTSATATRLTSADPGHNLGPEQTA